MFGLPLAFAAPAALAALALLAALYLFLKVTPPRPREVVFPPLRLLIGLDRKDATPAKTPWPLLLLRIVVAGLVIVAMAGPIWNALPGKGDGPLLMVVDDGWAAAPSWERRAAYARAALEAATRAGRLVALAPTSQGGMELAALDAPRGEDRLRALAPVALRAAAHGGAAADRPFSRRQPAGRGCLGRRRTRARRRRRVRARTRRSGARPQAFGRARRRDGDRRLRRRQRAGALKAHLTRAGADGRRAGMVQALDAQGRSIGEAPFEFGLGRATDAKFELPVELRNQIARLAVADEASAGATWLVDENSRRRRVAIVSGASVDVAQPLLSPAYYIRRALAPYAEIREVGAAVSDPIDALLAEKPSVLALADMSVPPGPAHDKLAAFVESGGVLLRFAGTRLAAGDDDLTPTALRRGGRTLGGALSWETPKHIAAFDKDSPFFGLAAPDEVTVSRQVLAEPEPGLAGKTWARLADGTPLVTAARARQGAHRPLPRHRRHDLVEPAAVRSVRRHAAADCRPRRAGAGRDERRRKGGRGNDAVALSHARRFRRAWDAAGRRRADSRRFRRAGRRAPSARLLRSRRRA